MKADIAIHLSDTTTCSPFPERWIQYCMENSISYTTVDCYASDIMQHLQSAKGLLWCWHHDSPQDVLIAQKVIMAAQIMGLKVFPNMATCWHFNDKIAQKYLLEAIDAPLVPTHIFLNREEALSWAAQTTFPKVFKLSKGAGAQNVNLVKSIQEAKSLIKKAFDRGFKPVPGYFSDAQKKVRQGLKKGDLLAKIRRLPWAMIRIFRSNKLIGLERGYAYFQDFMPDNRFDTRVTVIGDRAFAFIRYVRPGDFRASGSGNLDYNMEMINKQCILIAFEVAQKTQSQSLALDFINDPTGKPKITEISYAYAAEAVYNCPGHWDRATNWHEGHMWPQDAILIDLLRDISLK